MDIRLIKRDEIDKLKWDSCVHYAGNGNIYGYSWYLDNVSENWEGLVEGDYESVFPLIWNDKLLGIKQIYQPFLAQQTGIYSIHILSNKRIQAFLSAIPAEYKKVVLHLNERNAMQTTPDGFAVEERVNLVLDLNKSYKAIESQYAKNHKRNLKKAREFKVVLNSNIKPEVLMEQYKKYQGVKIKDFKDDSYHAAHRIIYNAMHRGRGFMSGVQTPEGKLLAAAFFVVSHGRMILLFPSTTPQGRAQNAMHLLIDMLIQSKAGSPLFLDFEGSSVESIARFYSGFGAINHPYYVLRKNELPFGLKWLKP